MHTPLSSKTLSWIGLSCGTYLALAGQVAAQSAWTQPEGHTYVQLSLQRIGPYDEVFQDRGADFVPGRKLTQTTLEAYAEYGLSEDWTLIGMLPIHLLDAGALNSNPSIPASTPSGSETALGNIRLGLGRQLARAEFALATQLLIEVPSGTLDRSTGLSSGLDAFSFLPSISLGRGFGSAYAQGYLGLGLRSNDHSNDWRMGLESGYRFERLGLACNLDVVSSLSDGDVRAKPSNAQTALYLDEQEYVAFGLKAHYALTPKLSLQAAARFAASGNNVASSPFLTLGIAWNW